MPVIQVILQQLILRLGIGVSSCFQTLRIRKMFSYLIKHFSLTVEVIDLFFCPGYLRKIMISEATVKAAHVSPKSL